MCDVCAQIHWEGGKTSKVDHGADAKDRARKAYLRGQPPISEIHVPVLFSLSFECNVSDEQSLNRLLRAKVASSDGLFVLRLGARNNQGGNGKEPVDTVIYKSFITIANIPASSP